MKTKFAKRKMVFVYFQMKFEQKNRIVRVEQTEIRNKEAKEKKKLLQKRKTELTRVSYVRSNHFSVSDLPWKNSCSFFCI